jgi:hypothetical protein
MAYEEHVSISHVIRRLLRSDIGRTKARDKKSHGDLLE